MAATRGCQEGQSVSGGLRWTEDQLAAYTSRTLEQIGARHGLKAVKVVKPSKYRNKKVKTDEGTFDSRWEHECWQNLKLREKAGEITNLKRQVSFDLIPAANLDGRKLPMIKYVADFVYLKDGVQCVVDAKGGESLPDYKLKRRLMYWIHGIRVVEVRKK